MTEKEINEKYPQVAANLGQRIYVLCLPVIEVIDFIGQMLSMNRDMARIKQAEAIKNEAPKYGAVEMPEVQLDTQATP